MNRPVEVHDSVDALAPEWDRLAERVAAPPFLRRGWLEAWLRAFGSGSLALLAARDGDGDLAGVLPTLLRRGVTVSPTNWHSPMFAVLADGPEAAGALATALVERRTRRIDLALLDPGSFGLAELRAAATAAGLRQIVRTPARSPYIAIEGDWETYERERLGRKLRKEIARGRRRLAEAGELTVAFEDGGDELAARLDEGFAIEASGWKTDSAISARPETERFYRDVARWARDEGWLSLAFLRLDGRAIAFDLCLEACGAVYVLKGGFDPGYRKFGPGTILTHDSLERAFRTGATSYELLGKEDPYKLRWTDTTRERVRLQAFSRSPAGRLEHLAWRRGRPVAKRALERLGRGSAAPEAGA